MLKRLVSYALAALLLLPAPVWAAIAFGSANSCRNNGSTGACTAAITVSDLSTGYMLIGCYSTDTANQTFTVTYNGSATGITSIGSETADTITGGGVGRADLWGLKAANFSAGAHNVVVTPSAGEWVTCGVTELTGVDQTTPSENVAVNRDAAGSSAIATVNVTNTAGNWAVASVAYNFDEVTGEVGSTTSGTQRWALDTNGFNAGTTVGITSTSSGTATLTFTGAGAHNWAIVGASIRANAGGGGGATTRTRMLLGVGQ